MEDSVIPYRVVVKGDGTWYPKIVGTHPMQVNNSGIRLPAGPCRVAISWDGKNLVDLVLDSGGTTHRPVSLAAKSEVGPRSTMVTIGAHAGDWIQLNTKSAAGETGTIEVYPIPVHPYPGGAA